MPSAYFQSIFLFYQQKNKRKAPVHLLRQTSAISYSIIMLYARLFSSFSTISSIFSFVITSGGTRRSTSLPAEITRSPFSSAFVTILPTVVPVMTSHCMKPFPRRAATTGYLSTSLSSCSSRYGVSSCTCARISSFS